jgi:ribonuclease BN (tRNA processing enzyme)
MRLKVLGCSGGIGVDLRTTSLMIDDDILIDAGTGVSQLTLEQMAGLRHIFLTHTHLDHIAGLPLLVDSIFDRIHEPLVIHGQPATIEAVQQHIFNWVVWPDFARLPRADAPVMRYEIMRPGARVGIGGRELEMIPVNHVVPGVGYRVTGPEGGVFAFSGDTTTNDTLWAALNAHERLDLLIVECAFTDADIEIARLAYHYCPQLLAADLRKLRHRPALRITHLKPGGEAGIMDQCVASIDDREVLRLGATETFQL